MHTLLCLSSEAGPRRVNHCPLLEECLRHGLRCGLTNAMHHPNASSDDLPSGLDFRLPNGMRVCAGRPGQLEHRLRCCFADPLQRLKRSTPQLSRAFEVVREPLTALGATGDLQDGQGGVVPHAAPAGQLRVDAQPCTGPSLQLWCGDATDP